MTQDFLANKQARLMLLRAFESVTGVPVGIFEGRGNSTVGNLIENERVSGEYCRMIQSLPGGIELCAADEHDRAASALTAGEPLLSVCHAGLFNESVPIDINGEAKVVLLYGEALIRGEKYQQQSLEKFCQIAQRMSTSSDEDQLWASFCRVRTFESRELEALRSMLPIVEWFYALVAQEAKLRANFEDMAHELQTRMQPLIADAEGLYEKRNLPGMGEIDPLIRRVMASSMALDTVLQSQSLGDWLGDYSFRGGDLLRVVRQAVDIYRPEAERKEVDIRIATPDDEWPKLKFSRDHLQYAFNNLVQNAVKYSFQGGPERYRFIRISGREAGAFYCVEIENFGVGILQEEIDGGLLFRDGYQGRLTRGEYRKGAGKGLAFVHRVISKHNGKITVSCSLVGSQDDPPQFQPHLTTFSVLLPYDGGEGGK